MSASLDRAIEATRERDLVWDEGRAARVLAAARGAHDARIRRGKLLRRASAVAGGAVLVVVALLRVTSAAPSAAGGPSAAGSPAEREPRAELLTAAREGDGGFARD